MSEIRQIVMKYSNQSLKWLLVLNVFVRAIIPVVSIYFLNLVLQAISSGGDIVIIIVVGIFYICLSFLSTFTRELLMVKIGEYRLATLVTEYFNLVVRIPVYLREDVKFNNIIEKGEEFSAQSWRGYQRLMINFSTLLSNIIAILLLFVTNNVYGKVFIATMLIISWISLSYTKTMRVYNDEMRNILFNSKKYSSFYGSIFHDSHSLKEVKTSSFENYIDAKLNKNLITTLANVHDILMKYNLKIFVGGILAAIPYILAVGLDIIMIRFGYIEITQAIVLLSLVKTLQDLIKSTLEIVDKNRQDIQLYEDYSQFVNSMTPLSLPKKHDKENNTQEQELIDIVSIEFINVSYKYPNNDNYAIRDFYYNFNAYQRYAIVGESGSGKSTLIKLVCGFIRPTEGYILINNQDINTIDMQRYHRSLASVFQNSELLAFPIIESLNVKSKSDSNLLKKIQELELDMIISSFPQNIDTYYSKKTNDQGIELSGGELQMFTLLRSVLKTANMYVLDEPTSAMDVNNEIRMINSFITMTKNKLSLIVTHRLVITKYCDTILVLNEGDLIESGHHTQLIKTNGYYANLYRLQNEGYGDIV